MNNRLFGFFMGILVTIYLLSCLHGVTMGVYVNSTPVVAHQMPGLYYGVLTVIAQMYWIQWVF